MRMSYFTLFSFLAPRPSNATVIKNTSQNNVKTEFSNLKNLNGISVYTLSARKLFPYCTCPNQWNTKTQVSHVGYRWGGQGGTRNSQ